MDPFTILAALAPLGVDLGKSLIAKFIGSDFKPSNMNEWVSMQKMDIERFTALQAAGGSNPSYPWVEAIIRLQRPAVAAVALGTWAFTIWAGQPSEVVNNFAGAIGFYLFGDRTLFYARTAAKK